MKRALLILPLLAACPRSDAPAPPVVVSADAGTPEWAPVLEDLDGALLSIFGFSATDVWSVGGPLGNTGFEPLVVHYTGEAWHRLHPGGAETYWWIHGTSSSDLWLVGEKGRMTHYDGSAFTETAPLTTATLFGVFAFASDDVWAVGGTPDDANGANDVILHWTGEAWAPETLPAPTKSALFKVWGSSKDDIYVVGDAGVIWHRKAGAWAREGEGLAGGRLTTVTGCSATEIYAVGGRDILRSDGTTWSKVDAGLLVNDVNGVACAPKDAPSRAWGDVVIVGGGSLKLRLAGGAWQNDFGAKPFSDLHGSSIDPTGAMWGAGGVFTSSPQPGVKRLGVIARLGNPPTPSSILDP